MEKKRKDCCESKKKIATSGEDQIALVGRRSLSKTAMSGEDQIAGLC